MAAQTDPYHRYDSKDAYILALQTQITSADGQNPEQPLWSQNMSPHGYVVAIQSSIPAEAIEFSMNNRANGVPFFNEGILIHRDYRRFNEFPLEHEFYTETAAMLDYLKVLDNRFIVSPQATRPHLPYMKDKKEKKEKKEKKDKKKKYEEIDTLELKNICSDFMVSRL